MYNIKNKIRLSESGTHTTGCNISSGIILDTLATEKNKTVDIYINMLTLYRNFVDTLEADTNTKILFFKSSIDINTIYNKFLDDTTIFLEAIMELGFNPIVFIPTYKKLKKRWSNFKELNDFKSIHYFIHLTETGVIKQFKDRFKNVVIDIDYKLPYNKDMFIMTHIAFDLLNYIKHRDIKLIESHTGKIKKYDEFFTKYHKLGKYVMSVMPFNEILLQIYGDSANLLTSQNIKVRRRIYDILINSKVYHNVTSDNVISIIKRRDPQLGNDIADMYKHIY